MSPTINRNASALQMTASTMIEAVTSADIQRAAKTYLTQPNRTVIDRKPAAMIEAAKTASTATNTR